MTAFDDVLCAAQNLPPSERIRLIDILWKTVPPDEWPAPSDKWPEEARRRSEEYDAGRMSAAGWSDVRRRARREAGLDG